MPRRHRLRRAATATAATASAAATAFVAAATARAAPGRAAMDMAIHRTSQRRPRDGCGNPSGKSGVNSAIHRATGQPEP